LGVAAELVLIAATTGEEADIDRATVQSEFGRVTWRGILRLPWRIFLIHLTTYPVVDANKCRFINVALDEIATTIAGAQHTLRPFVIVVRPRLQFQQENPIANLEIEMHGIVITINVVALFASTRDPQSKNGHSGGKAGDGKRKTGCHGNDAPKRLAQIGRS